MEIEKNVPIPTKRRKLGSLSQTLFVMNVGDSIVAPITVRSGLSVTAKQAGIKYTSQKISATELRIWRTG